MLVIGAADAGKTTFTAWLANHLRQRGHDVGIVDADVGQSEIGPPATVGLGAVRGPLTRPGDAETVAFEFVGVTSPGRHPWQVAGAAAKLVRVARARFDRVVVDTSGFIAGGFAAAVKQRKIAATDPDVVVAIQAGEECEHILRGIVARERGPAARGVPDRPLVLRLPAVHGTRRRTVADRRRHRAAVLARYFAEARAITLDATRVPLRSVAGDAVALDALVVGTLVGVRDAAGGSLALGAIEGVDSARQTLTLTTPAAPARIASVTIGETTREG